MNITGNSEQSVSVSIEDVKQNDWTEKVYKPDIERNWNNTLQKNPVIIP
jgi:hypothetical protein